MPDFDAAFGTIPNAPAPATPASNAAKQLAELDAMFTDQASGTVFVNKDDGTTDARFRDGSTSKLLIFPEEQEGNRDSTWAHYLFGWMQNPFDDLFDRALEERWHEIEQNILLDYLTADQAAEMADVLGAVPSSQTIGSIAHFVRVKAPEYRKDVTRGVIEAPRQMVGGGLDAAQAMSDLVYTTIDPLADWLERNIPLGGVQLFDRDGNFAPDYVPPEEVNPDEPPPSLLAIDPAKTTTGGIVRKVSQWGAGW